jgi:hypothetical protein
MEHRNKGLILVFDLDQTLIDTEKLFRRKDPPSEFNGVIFESLMERIDTPHRSDNVIHKQINHRLIEEVLAPASELRGRGVDGIFLLTNNNSNVYVKAVGRYLANKLGNTDGNEYFFDYIMTRNDPSRGANPLSKNLSNIKHMLRTRCPFSHKIREPVEIIDDLDLAERLFFFDDQIYPLYKEIFQNIGLGSNRKLGLDLPNFSDHYIHMRGTIQHDTTDYSIVKEALARIAPPPGFKGGSKRSRGQLRHKTHRGRSKKRRMSRRH